MMGQFILLPSNASAHFSVNSTAARAVVVATIVGAIL